MVSALAALVAVLIAGVNTTLSPTEALHFHPFDATTASKPEPTTLQTSARSVAARSNQGASNNSSSSINRSGSKIVTTQFVTTYGTEVVYVSTTTGTTAINNNRTTAARPSPQPTNRKDPVRGVNRCSTATAGLVKLWRVLTTDADLYNDPAIHCGSGYLDNFRGQCRLISRWECGCTDGRPWPCRDIWMNFVTDIFCQPAHIAAAVTAASHGNIDMQCKDGTLD